MGEGYLRPKIYVQYGIPAYAMDHVWAGVMNGVLSV